MPENSPASTDSTAERLLDAAEALFSEQGIAAVSLRAITARAEANLAAVNYHFGSRDGLVRAVLGRRVQPINAARLVALDAVEAAAGSGPLALADVLRAFLEPALAMGRGSGRPFFLLVARAQMSTEPEVREQFVAQFEDVAARFGAALSRALPGVPPPEILWRVHFIVGALCHTVANGHLVELISKGACRPDDPALLERLVSFATAGLGALQRSGDEGEARS